MRRVYTASGPRRDGFAHLGLPSMPGGIMARVEVEARSTRSRAWTYMIVALGLIGAIVLVNVVFSNPAAAKQTAERLFGLPGWALTAVVAALGLVIFWAGLKV